MDEQAALPTEGQLSALTLVFRTGTGPFPKDPLDFKKAFYECEHLGWIRYAHDGEFRLTGEAPVDRLFYFQRFLRNLLNPTCDVCGRTARIAGRARVREGNLGPWRSAWTCSAECAAWFVTDGGKHAPEMAEALEQHQARRGQEKRRHGLRIVRR